MTAQTLPAPSFLEDRPRSALIVLALSTLALVLFLLYGNWLERQTPVAWSVAWHLLGPALLFNDFLNPLYGSLLKVAAAVYVCLALAAAAVRFGRPSTWAKVALAAGIAAVAVFPAALPRLHGPYLLYAQAAPGYEMQWLTEPATAWSSAFRQAQRAHEKHGCRYSIRGWSMANVLYYSSDCLPGYWRFDPAQSDKPQLTLALPSDVSGRVERRRGGAYPERPAELAGKHDWYIVYETSRSPNGEYLAAAITNFYGPRDAVVLRRSGAGP